MAGSGPCACSTHRIHKPENEPLRREVRRVLTGKNLGCWCPEGTPCHADVLLKLANKPPPLLA